VKKLKFVDPELNFLNLEDLDQFNQLIEVLKYALDNQLHSNNVTHLKEYLSKIEKSKSKYCQENKMAALMDQIDYAKIGLAVAGVMLVAAVGYKVRK